MKKFSVKSVVAIGIGAALFFVLGRFVAIPTPIPNTNITVQYALLGFMAAVYGPIAGCLIGLIGHILIDFTGYGLWWSWIIATAAYGLIMGFGIQATKVDDAELGKAGIIKFNIISLLAHLLSWGVIAPGLDILIYSEPMDKVFAQGMTSGIVNIITTAVLGTLICVAYSATKTKAGSLTEE